MAEKKPRTPIVQKTDAPATRCPQCQSENRERYENVTRQEFSGRDGAGREFRAIIRRWTRCSDCGQTRIDRSFEYIAS